MKDWLPSYKEHAKEYKKSRYREQPLSLELRQGTLNEQFWKKGPGSKGWHLELIGKSMVIAERMAGKFCRGFVFMAISGNSPSGLLGDAL